MQVVQLQGLSLCEAIGLGDYAVLPVGLLHRPVDRYLGDFNCAEGSRPYSVLVSDDLVDTYRALYPEHAEGEGTFNGFKGTKSGARIDWILASPSWTVRAATLDDHSVDGRYPSDHFPVSAVLE